MDGFELPPQQLLPELMEPGIVDVADTLLVEEANQRLVVDL